VVSLERRDRLEKLTRYAGTLVALERWKREPWVEPIRRPWGARPSRFENVAVAVTLVLFLVCRSDADALFGAGVWAVPVATIFALAWIARLCNPISRRLQLRRTASERRAWLVLPIALGIGIVDLRCEIAFRTRLALSAGALRAAAERAVSAANDGREANPRLGLFWTSARVDESSVVRFQTTRGLWFQDYGLAYAPGMSPKDGADTEYHHVSGPWWVWVRHGSFD
jgi:hypothetical protein